MKPVTLPLGRDRLLTMPLPTGSGISKKSTGRVRVCSRMARVAGVTWVTIRSGRVSMMSLAICGRSLRGGPLLSGLYVAAPGPAQRLEVFRDLGPAPPTQPADPADLLRDLGRGKRRAEEGGPTEKLE